MNRIFLLLIIVFSIQTKAQNNAPIVSNVTFSQRTDGSFFVDIYYDVYDPDSNYMTVTMYSSSDAGSTWDFSCAEVTGDARHLVQNGTRRHIVWDFGTEHPEYSSDQIRIKIVANDCIYEGDGVSCPGVSTVEYEGTIYNTVQIGDQCWLKENLNIGKMLVSESSYDEPSDDGVIEKYCYENDTTNCEKYGGLYYMGEVVYYDTTGGSGDICPEGWHVPDYNDLHILVERVGRQMNALLAVGEQNGTNTSGFSALFAGARETSSGSFLLLGKWAAFWGSTKYDREVGFGYDGLRFYGNTSRHDVLHMGGVPTAASSVRCIQD